ncbi:MAG: helix-turn-helix transcriptional regulator [Clostridia bacterium]|nr:helix-turn-helix transcriptional regulator [Clostridia bacterium]
MKNSVKFSANTEFVNFKYAKGEIDIYQKMFHESFEIYLFLGGDVEFINNHTRRKLNPYELVIVPPGEYHQFAVRGELELYERCVIDIAPDFFEDGVLKEAFSDKELIALSLSDRIVEHYAYLKECAEKLSEKELKYILPAIAVDIVFLIKNIKGSCKFSQEDSTRSISFLLMKYIDEYYCDDISLNFLAEHFHSSVSLICHKFKSDFGIGIKKYINQKRLLGASRALQSGENAELVCMKYGFLNYSTFYRAYKNRYGIAPSETFKRNYNK